MEMFFQHWAGKNFKGKIELRKRKKTLDYYTDNSSRTIQTDIYTKTFPVLDANIIIYCSVPRALRVLCDKQNWNDYHIF